MPDLSKLIVIEILKQAKYDYDRHVSILNRIHSKYQTSTKDNPCRSFGDLVKLSMGRAISSEAHIKQIIHLKYFFVGTSFDKEIDLIEDYDAFINEFISITKRYWEISAQRSHVNSSDPIDDLINQTEAKVFYNNYNKYKTIILMVAEREKGSLDI
jgi:hypothetical protein